jgi:hypothetical protein
MAMII